VHTATDETLCPVGAVLAWRGFLIRQGIDSGPLFTRVDRWGNAGRRCGGRYTDDGRDSRDGRLRPQAIGQLVTAAARRAGLAGAELTDGSRAYTGHSLRRGGATTMLAAGAAPLEVSRHGRWADGSRSFAGYIEEAHGFGETNPTKGLL
jgi:integrase